MVASHRTDPNAIAVRPHMQDAEADESGPVICACFGVGLEAIRRTVRNGAGSLAMVSAALGAGTNCGSCLPELKRIIAQARRAATA